MKREASPLSISSLEHAERVHIGFEQRLLLLALVAVLLAQADNDTQCLDVKAVALGLGIDIANVVADRFFLFLEPLDPLDKGFELILGKTAGGLIVFDGGSSSHWTLRAQFSQSAASIRSCAACGQARSALIHSTAQANRAAQRPSMLLTCFFERSLLFGRGVLLVFGAPFVIGHAVDDLAALLLGHRDSLGVGGIFHPVGEAVAAKTGQIHQIDVLHVGARAQVLDQAAVDGGFEFRTGILIDSHNLLRKLPMDNANIETRRGSFHTPFDAALDTISKNPGWAAVIEATVTTKSRELLESLFRVAVATAHPSRCLPPHLPEAPPRGRLIVLAAGKAAGSLTEVAEKDYAGLIAQGRLDGVAVARHGYGRPTQRIAMVEAGHPVPDEAGVAGTERALALADGASADDLVLVLLSGGASANWIAPAAGITLAEKQATTRALLRSGAKIGEINCVRKHLSRIKGGRLARRAAPARVVTLAISDVPGDDPAVIGSGPTVPDPTTLGDARAIVEKYRLDLPPAVTRALADPGNESPHPGPASRRASGRPAARAGGGVRLHRARRPPAG